MVGVTALVWSCTKHQLRSTDFSTTIKVTTTSDSSPHSHLCTAYVCSCTHVLEAFLLCSIPHLRLLLGSLHQSSLQAANQAQLSTATYQSTWQRSGFPVPASRNEGWPSILAVWPKIPTFPWAKTTMPHQKARPSPRNNFRPGLPFYTVLLHREEHHHMLESWNAKPQQQKKRIKELIYICLVFNNHYQMSECVLCLWTSFQEENHKNKVILSH